jgi:predicted RNase H-like HicB family nuclease
MTFIEFDMRIGTRQEAPGVWVAWCPSLDLHTQAGTQDGAGKAIREAAGLWFEDCVSRGTIDAALREVGYFPAHPSQMNGDVHRDGFDVIEVGGTKYEREIDYLALAPAMFHWELCAAHRSQIPASSA